MILEQYSDVRNYLDVFQGVKAPSNASRALGYVYQLTLTPLTL